MQMVGDAALGLRYRLGALGLVVCLGIESRFGVPNYQWGRQGRSLSCACLSLRDSILREIVFPLSPRSFHNLLYENYERPQCVD